MAEFAAPSAMNDQARLWLSTPTSERAKPGRATHSLEHATQERINWLGVSATVAERGCG